MRFYKILKAKQCGNAEGLTAYERQFVEYLKKIDIKTITGVLPLTFTAKGGNAVDWVIYGNDDVGENLFDGTIVQGVWNSSTGQVPRILSSSTRLATNTMLALDATETYNIKVFSATSDTLVVAIKLLNSAKEQISDTGWVGVSTSITGADYIAVNIRKFDESVITPADAAGITITKGSTAPDHYIPYQQGVGERTENLFDIGTSISDYEHSNIITEIDSHSLSMHILGAGSTWTYRNKKISTTGEYTISLISDKCYPRLYIALRNQDDTGWLTDSDTSISGCYYNAVYHGWFKELATLIGSATASVSIPNCLYWQLGFGYNSISENVGTVGTLSNIMLVKGPTAPTTYIPYGYQIPLTVSQQGQPDKTVDIYIGDSPLTEGETVSKTSTGVDIELFEGENTVSTTLYNKPTMEIKYK